MKLIQTAIPDVVLIEPTIFYDDRGWFFESFHEEKFHQALKTLGLPTPARFVQDNHSCSKKNVLRGLHYQLTPYAQGKLVRVVKGAAFDVAVDIREGSPTFGQSISVELSADNHRMLWIPEGFAHGFLTLEDDTHFLYKTTNYYNKECEASILWSDPNLAIKWPSQRTPIVNEKDSLAPYLKDIKKTTYPNQSFRNEIIHLKVNGDERGKLISLQQGSNLPFDIKRAYYIFDTQPGVVRGLHAHKNLQQLAVCVAGKCRMVLDDGITREEFWLDSPTQGLLIKNKIWREMHDFSEDCVLVVLASEYYDESDYIRDYETFKCLVKQ